MLLQKDFGLQVGLDNFESLVKSLLELKPPLIYDFGFICLKIFNWGKKSRKWSKFDLHVFKEVLENINLKIPSLQRHRY